ncbi:hypothetical protein M9Y10_000156 [Tritrichomonas musculus]|uniref:Uncharacterized protein n=1 Tax=Tritrichomonas musculus TaxID=1915356 RepID=A0ABR2L3J3_9EUKA
MSEDDQNFLLKLGSDIFKSALINIAADKVPKLFTKAGRQQLAENPFQNVPEIIRDTAVTIAAYNSSKLILQKTFNVNDKDFEKQLYINISSAAIASLINNVAFYRDEGVKNIASAAKCAINEFAQTIIFNWSKGGREFVQQYFPSLYQRIIYNKTILSFLEMH